MYRNVLMSAAGPYNTAPYHLPIPRYHAPEDLSRNTGTKALDALHHAASQYYTTHKIHELSERALKSPTSGSGPVKVSVSSPSIGPPQQGGPTSSGPGSGPVSGVLGPGSGPNQQPGSAPGSAGGVPLNLQPPPGGMGPAPGSKPDLSGPKGHGGVTPGSSLDGHKQSMPGGPPPNGPPGNGAVGGVGGAAGNGAAGGGGAGAADSRSPPPQRHVHTHHHTHVGLGYPMYPAPYGGE